MMPRPILTFVVLIVAVLSGWGAMEDPVERGDHLSSRFTPLTKDGEPMADTMFDPAESTSSDVSGPGESRASPWSLFRSAWAAEDLLPPQGEPRPFAVADFAQHKRPDRAYTENWAYRIQLDSGHLLIVNMAITNIGTTSGNCVVEVTLLKDGAPIRSWNRGYSSERFRFDTKRGRISLAEDIFIEGIPPAPQHIKVVVSKNGGLDLDLRITDMVQGIRDGSLSWRFGGPQGPEFGQAAMFPRAKVSGSMTIAGRKFAARGVASADHQLLTALPTKVARDYLALKTHGPEYSIVLWRFESLPRFGSRHGGLLVVADATRTLWATRDFKVSVEETRDERGFDIPRKLTVSAKGPGGEILAAAFAITARLQSFALTDELDPVIAGVAQVLVGNPLFVRDAAKATVRMKRADGSEVRFEATGTQEINRMMP